MYNIYSIQCTIGYIPLTVYSIPGTFSIWTIQFLYNYTVPEHSIQILHYSIYIYVQYCTYCTYTVYTVLHYSALPDIPHFLYTVNSICTLLHYSALTDIPHFLYTVNNICTVPVLYYCTVYIQNCTKVHCQIFRVSCKQ